MKASTDSTKERWVCDAKGCYLDATISREATRHFGTNYQPVRVMLEGEEYHFCPMHLQQMRNWLADPNRAV